MARIPTSQMKTWRDSEVMYSSDYMRERDLIVTAVNDIENNLDTEYATQQQLEEGLYKNQIGDHTGTWQGLTPSEISIGLGIKPEDIGAATQEQVDGLADELNKVKSLRYHFNDYPRLATEVDDTGRFQRAFDTMPVGAELIIPDDIYYISETVTSNKAISLTFEGEAVVQATTPNIRMFHFTGSLGSEEYLLKSPIKFGDRFALLRNFPEEIEVDDYIRLADSPERTNYNEDIQQVSAIEPVGINKVLTPNMDTDSNLDGVSDNFQSLTTGTGTVSYSVDAGQKVSITSNTEGATVGEVFQEISHTTVDAISVGVDVKGAVSGDFIGRVYADFLDSTGISLGNIEKNIEISDSYTSVFMHNYLPPTGTVKIRVGVQAISNNKDSLGEVWFKNLIVKDATTKLYFKDYSNRDFTVNDAYGVLRLNMLEGIKITNGLFKNTSDSDNYGNIRLDFAVHSQIKNTEFSRFGDTAIWLLGCSNIVVDNCRFHHSNNLVWGRGMGVVTDYGSTHIRIRNSIFEDIFGGVLFNPSSNIILTDLVMRNVTGNGIIFNSYDHTNNVRIERCDIACFDNSVDTVLSDGADHTNRILRNISISETSFRIDTDENRTVVRLFYPTENFKIDKCSFSATSNTTGSTAIVIHPLSDLTITNSYFNHIDGAITYHVDESDKSTFIPNSKELNILNCIFNDIKYGIECYVGKELTLNMVGASFRNVSASCFYNDITKVTYKKFFLDNIYCKNAPKFFLGATGTVPMPESGSQVRGSVRGLYSDSVGQATSTNLIDSWTITDYNKLLFEYNSDGQTIFLSGEGKTSATTGKVIPNGFVEGQRLTFITNASTTPWIINKGTNIVFKSNATNVSMTQSTKPTLTLVWRNGFWYEI